MIRLYLGWRGLETWWRYGLVLQFAVATLLLFTALPDVIRHAKPEDRGASLILGWACLALVAPIGIMLNRAWGYFLQAPVLVPILIVMMALSHGSSRFEIFPGWHVVDLCFGVFIACGHFLSCIHRGLVLRRTGSHALE